MQTMITIMIFVMTVGIEFTATLQAFSLRICFDHCIQTIIDLRLSLH